MERVRWPLPCCRCCRQIGVNTSSPIRTKQRWPRCRHGSPAGVGCAARRWTLPAMAATQNPGRDLAALVALVRPGGLAMLVQPRDSEFLDLAAFLPNHPSHGLPRAKDWRGALVDAGLEEVI